MSSLSFEWNKKKSASNLKKHGVSFEQASTVFSDDFGRLIPDPDSQGEERFILMSTQARILTICHCERSSDVIRIISARKADKSERKQYEGYHHA
ncbi:MAG: BrnT family toxin [Gammaproteobacteria bacterium]|nr:BrnT family toxin [Gammaproteobacteria bacterium]